MIELMKNTGVYKLYYKGSSNFYIGSASQSFEKRLMVHLSELRKGSHHNTPLQRGYSKYGEESLVMEPLLICSNDACIEMEILAINMLRPSYNASNVSNTRLGVKASDELRKKLSVAKIGKTLSEEHKRNISTGVSGKIKISEEHKEKLRLLMSGRKLSTEVRNKIRYANAGKKHSDDTKKKMSASHSCARNTNKYHFVYKDGIEVIETVYYMNKKYNLGSHVYGLISGKRKSTKGWTLKNPIHEY